MLKMSYAGCAGPSAAISTQFTLKMCVAAGNRKKFANKPILWVQGYLRSSTLTLIKSLLPVLVMISSMSVPICNRFHATRDNCCKITTFYGGSRLSRLPALASLNVGGRDWNC